jgi:hypothetical protein
MKKVAVVRNFATIAFLLAFLIVLPAARAGESDQATKVTFNQSVQISGHILPAGTYWFVLPDDIDQHNVVSIFSSDRTKLYAIFLTAYAQRLQPTDKTAFTLAERGSELPQAIVTWFYPGHTIGHEFLYPKQVQKELGKDQQVTIVAGN